MRLTRKPCPLCKLTADVYTIKRGKTEHDNQGCANVQQAH